MRTGTPTRVGVGRKGKGMVWVKRTVGRLVLRPRDSSTWKRCPRCRGTGRT
jgi:hypothetical protein